MAAISPSPLCRFQALRGRLTGLLAGIRNSSEASRRLEKDLTRDSLILSFVLIGPGRCLAFGGEISVQHPSKRTFLYLCKPPRAHFFGAFRSVPELVLILGVLERLKRRRFHLEPSSSCRCDSARLIACPRCARLGFSHIEYLYD